MSLFCFPLCLSQFLGVFREQRQTALSCAADMDLAAQQDTALSLGVVLIFGINRRYFLLDVSERRVFLEESQTVTPFD
jgi:hypothetical protein